MKIKNEIQCEDKMYRFEINIRIIFNLSRITKM